MSISSWFSRAVLSAVALSLAIGFATTSSAQEDGGPWFTIRAGAVVMERSAPRDSVLFFNPGDTTQSINASDFDLGFRTGFDVALVADSLIGENGVEVRYLGIDGWNADASTSTLGAVTTIASTSPVTTFVGGFNIDSNYGSELDSFEVSLRHPVNDWLVVLGGYRQLELNEHFRTMFSDGASGDALYDVNTGNQLYGGQLGAEVSLLVRDQYRLETIGKVGIYGNSAEHSTHLVHQALDVTVADTTSDTSFVGELGFFLIDDLSDNCSLRVGYQMMWIEQVALGTEQLAATNFIFLDGINSTGGAFYHGGFLGLEGTW